MSGAKTILVPTPEPGDVLTSVRLSSRRSQPGFLTPDINTVQSHVEPPTPTAIENAVTNVNKFVTHHNHEPFAQTMPLYTIPEITEYLLQEHTITDMTARFAGYNYLGPGTHVIANLINGVRPTSYLDAIALVHDISYFVYTREAADNFMVSCIKDAAIRIPIAAMFSIARKVSQPTEPKPRVYTFCKRLGIAILHSIPEFASVPWMP